MIFNSIQFLIFFPLVTVIYFLLPHKWRWMHLLLASCIFYMAFVPVYILILLFTIVVDYIAGIMIEDSEGHRRKAFLVASLIANVGVLAVFKYYNFLTENVNGLLALAGVHTYTIPYLSILLPIGLSFHTFQAMSYTLEVYRGNQKAERHFGIYSLYVMFYPQLVAGPIERPQNLIHQFKEEHNLDYVRMRSGFVLMLWGFFQKVVIADRLGLYADPVFNHPADFNGVSVWLAVIFFGFQIYCDFSAYTNIARGAARIMGFELMKNFNMPFLAKNVTEFWRRWHISLSTWFNDYLYTPIVIARRDWGLLAVACGLIVTFFISGLWHGAAWTFVVWGLLHGLACIYELYTKKLRSKASKKIPPLIYNSLSRLFLFLFLQLTWVFFRAHNFHDAHTILSHAFAFTQGNSFKIGFFKLGVYDISRNGIILSVLAVGAALVVDSYQYFNKPIVQVLFSLPAVARWAIYYTLLFGIFELGVFSKTSFIYFQF